MKPFSIERLVKDNSRLSNLELDLAKLTAELDVPFSGFHDERTFELNRLKNLKSLRLKSRAYLSLLSVLSRLELETIIQSYE